MKRLLLSALLALPAAASVSVKSPNGQIEFLADVDNSGRLVYTVSSGGKAVIEQSALGITVAGADLGAGAALGDAARSSIDETYPMRGVKTVAVNRCNTAAIDVAKGAQKWILEVRAYDDGVGWRYVVPGTGDRAVTGEATAFKLPTGSKVWWQEFMLVGQRYEKLYTATDISAFASGAIPAGMMTAEVPGVGYAWLSEANVVNTPGMYYTCKGGRSLQATFTEASWTMTGDIQTSWRVVLVAADLNALVNSDLVRNLCPPPAAGLFQADWIKPGMAVWNWVQNRAITVDNMKRYSKIAGQLGFAYNTVDAGWEGWTNAYTAMKDLCDYSAQQNVKIWAWKRWTEMDTQDKRKAFFAKLNAAGVVGIKVDGIDNENVVVDKFLTASLKDAVDYKIMILWHGCPKPTGIERTWPNEIGREAIRGMENKPPWAPSNTTFPFTRLIAGPADFTPLVLTMPARSGETSWAHQIGTVVSYTAPFTNLSGDPQSILDNPAVEFIKSIPTEWDETVVLPQSRIGDLLAFARRRGKAWFVTVLNGSTTTARKVAINTAFLGAGTWDASLVKDELAKVDAVVQEAGKAKTTSTYTADLRPGGGWVARFVNPNAVAILTRPAAKPRLRSRESVVLFSAQGRILPAPGSVPAFRY